MSKNLEKRMREANKLRQKQAIDDAVRQPQPVSVQPSNHSSKRTNLGWHYLHHPDPTMPHPILDARIGTWSYALCIDEFYGGRPSPEELMSQPEQVVIAGTLRISEHLGPEYSRSSLLSLRQTTAMRAGQVVPLEDCLPPKRLDVWAAHVYGFNTRTDILPYVFCPLYDALRLYQKEVERVQPHLGAVAPKIVISRDRKVWSALLAISNHTDLNLGYIQEVR